MNTQVPLWVPFVTAILGFLAVLVPAVAIFFTRNNLFKQLREQREMMERQFKEQRDILDRQISAQITTTVNKEWIANVRECITKLIQYFIISKDLRRKYVNENLSAVPEFEELNKQFIEVHIRLSLYLDFSDEDETELYHTHISRLWTIFSFGEDKFESVELIKQIQHFAQSIFWHKLNPISLARFIPTDESLD